MKDETYKALLKDLQKLQNSLVASQIAGVRRDATLAARLARLHAEAEVGGGIDDFVATTARKSTVLFLLRTVFVRVLEDLGILELKRIRSDWGFAAFREVAPALDHRAYFRFVFRDLAIDFPALFAPGDDELPLPDEDGCVGVWELWHHPNRDGEHYVWNGEGFDSRFLGDLYQDLDKDIRKRFALLQTPRFVEEYILDHALTPALVEFDPADLRAKSKTFRLIDPTCGSGHFLIGAFHRLADYWRDRHSLSEWEACERALESVWGCDINPHAVDIAEFRLLLEVVARTRVKDLDRLAALKLNLRAMDSLIPWERGAKQGELFPAMDRLDAYSTPKQRSENAAFLGRDFHVVVANPPYITPKDVRKRDDYRAFWPNSAAGKYALSAPFAERVFSLGSAGAYTGQITANSFMKREFGKRLITVALPRFDVTGVIDTSGAYVPGHGTPTVILFGRSRGRVSNQIWVVLGKRGEPRRPDVPALGLVWSAIVAATPTPSDASPFVTSAVVLAEQLARHPWSLGGGEAANIKATLEESPLRLGRICESIGNLTKMIADEMYFDAPPSVRRSSDCPSITLLEGEYVRDWDASRGVKAIYPYNLGAREPLVLSRENAALKHFWRARGILWERRSRASKFAPLRTIAGAKFYEYPFYAPDTTRGLGICFPFVSTHNQFVLDCGGKIFNRTAPVIKLPPAASADDFLDLLGLLNTSTLGFWMKQVLHNKGNSTDAAGARTTGEAAFDSFEYDSKKLLATPLSEHDRDLRVAFASALDRMGNERAACLPAFVLSAVVGTDSSLDEELIRARQRYDKLTHIMVALQEELDWLTYTSYGLIGSIDVVDPSLVEPLAPGHRPFEIVLARRDDDADDEEKSAWWSRHGHARASEVPEEYSPALRERIRLRIEIIESDARIALLETPPFKRRWQLADWSTETRNAARTWLLERLEDLFTSNSKATQSGPLASPKPYRLEEIVAAWSRDPNVVQVAGLWAGTGLSVDLTVIAEKLLRTEAIPDNALRVYSTEGMRKLLEWKRVWALQDQEDSWEATVCDPRSKDVTLPERRLVDPEDASKAMASIPLPPRFERPDFLKAEYFSIRSRLNIPREQFILFNDLSPPRFGWNGWRDRERALAQVEAFTLAENDPHQPLPVPTTDDPRRCGVTIGLWESLPDVKRWGDAAEYAELLSLAQEACRQPRCPCPVLDAWKARVLRGDGVSGDGVSGDGLAVLSNGEGKAKTKVTKSSQRDGAAEGGSERTVSLPERAWIAALLETGKDVDLAAIWALHRRRIDEVTAAANGGASNGQLRFAEVDNAVPTEVRALDEGRLAVVIDDLVASGDLEARGRGKKKRYQLVPRGTRV